jgi:hypothetical protein
MRFLTILLIGFFAVILIFASMVKEPDDSRLQELGSRIAQVEASNVNNGGCGLFALYVTDYLDSAGISYEILRVDDDRSVIPNHVMVKVHDSDNESLYIDATGFKSYRYACLFGYYRYYISKDSLKSLIAMPGWNRSFNRADTVIIKKELQWR